MYINSYFTSDYILYIKKYNEKNKKNNNNNKYFITIYNKIIIDTSKFDNCNFIFTKNPSSWLESSTLNIIYNDIKYSIGEFQIHNNRNNVKFRFNRYNLHLFINLL
jgi:hypothetical protein